MSMKFYKEFYYIIYNVLITLKTNNELRQEFFKIREKYDLTSYIDYSNEKDIKEFFIKLYEFADELQNRQRRYFNQNNANIYKI